MPGLFSPPPTKRVILFNGISLDLLVRIGGDQHVGHRQCIERPYA